jgi:aminopeptidase C
MILTDKCKEEFFKEMKISKIAFKKTMYFNKKITSFANKNKIVLDPFIFNFGYDLAIDSQRKLIKQKPTKYNKDILKCLIEKRKESKRNF